MSKRTQARPQAAAPPAADDQEIRMIVAARLGACCRSEGYRADAVGLDFSVLILILLPMLKSFLEDCGAPAVQRSARRGGVFVRLLVRRKVNAALSKMADMDEDAADAFFKADKLTRVFIAAAAESTPDELTRAAALKP